MSSTRVSVRKKKNIYYDSTHNVFIALTNLSRIILQ